jgi:D-alanyl-D-alanine carboxypeptidase
VTKRHKRGRPRLSWYGLGLVVFSDGSYGHTGTLENTHAMFVVRPDGVTWAVLVSGENPWETSDLRTMVDNALFAALAPR